MDKMTTAPYGIQEGCTDVVCGPCHLDSISVQAVGICIDCREYLCKMCFDSHMKFPIAQNHELSNIQGKQRMKDRIYMKDTCTEICKFHHNETINYLCKEHSSLGCSVCCVLNHRTCSRVEYIPGQAKHLTKSKEFRESEQLLQHVTEKSRKMSMKAEEKIKSVNSLHFELQQDLKNFRIEINDMLDTLENELVITLENFKRHNIKGLTYAIDTCEEINTEIKSVLVDNENLRKKGQYCNLFVRTIGVRERVETLEKRLNYVDDTLKMKQRMFLPNLTLLETIKGVKGLGEFKEVDSKEVIHVSPPQKLVPRKDLNARSTTDTLPCKITSCVTLRDGVSLILSDYNNKKIKKYNIKDMSLCSEVQISGWPWDLEILEDGDIAVTVPCEKKILLIATDKDLVVERDIILEGDCHGIAQYNRDTLAVTFGDNNRIEMINFDGRVESSICNQQNQPIIFQKPLFVTTNRKANMLYVSNFKDSSIVCLKVDGSFVWKYTDSQLSGPLNIALDSDGMIYVCGKRSHNIHQISKDCKQYKVCLTVEDLETKPYSICYNEKCDRFYVGMLDIDNVRVFEAVRALM